MLGRRAAGARRSTCSPSSPAVPVVLGVNDLARLAPRNGDGTMLSSTLRRAAGTRSATPGRSGSSRSGSVVGQESHTITDAGLAAQIQAGDIRVLVASHSQVVIHLLSGQYHCEPATAAAARCSAAHGFPATSGGNLNEYE